jgi:hypothetical protein
MSLRRFLWVCSAPALAAPLLFDAAGCAASATTGPGFAGNSDDGGGASSSSSSSGSGSSGSSGSGGSTSGGASSGGFSASSSGGSSSSGGPASSGGSGSGSGSSGNGFQPDAEPCPSPSAPIDDMENGMGTIFKICGRIGFWYTYHDSTAGGTLTPMAMATFTDSAVTPARPIGDSGTSAMAARMTGNGFTIYGAGMGFDLQNPGGQSTKGLYDASMYSGVTFWAKGSVSGTGVVRFNVPDKATDPVGGVCSGTGASQCSDDHGHTLTLTSSWQQYSFTWAQLTQQGFGYTEASLDTAHLVGMKFQVGNPTGSFDVWVDDIAFLP